MSIIVIFQFGYFGEQLILPQFHDAHKIFQILDLHILFFDLYLIFGIRIIGERLVELGGVLEMNLVLRDRISGRAVYEVGC
jgi:hypothetical protein